MEKIKISILLGSLRKESFNRMLANEAIRLSPKGVEFEFVDLESLPHFNGDLEENFPDSATKAKTMIENSDGVLFVSPEYNHSLPGFLKNGIDWISRPGKSNGSSFDGMPGAVMGASTGRIATARMQTDMRRVFASQNIYGMNTPELQIAQAHKVFDEKGIAREPFDRLISNYMQSFYDWIIEHS